MATDLWTPWICLAGWFIAAAPLHAQIIEYDQFDDYDLAMFDRPKLVWKAESKVEYGDGLIELWSRALDRPDAELQRLVIDTLAIAHRRGVEGVDAMKPRLIEMAKTPDQSLDVVRALSQTLIEFDASDQAPVLGGIVKEARRTGRPDCRAGNR